VEENVVQILDLIMPKVEVNLYELWAMFGYCQHFYYSEDTYSSVLETDGYDVGKKME
jgi:hypothetical protein